VPGLQSSFLDHVPTAETSETRAETGRRRASRETGAREAGRG